MREGRHDFLAQFPSIAAIRETLAAPEERATFAACKLDWAERERNARVVALHREVTKEFHRAVDRRAEHRGPQRVGPRRRRHGFGPAYSASISAAKSAMTRARFTLSDGVR